MNNHEAVTRVLHQMSLDGWANESDGDVEAPTGWFAYMINEPAERDSLVDAFGDVMADEDVTVDQVMGAWLLMEDSFGFKYAVSAEEAGSIRAMFAQLSRGYLTWATADEDDPNYCAD